jgi:hypothetical protein
LRKLLANSANVTILLFSQIDRKLVPIRFQGNRSTLPMAYKIYFNIPERELGKNDIVITVKRNKEKLGDLLLSKGGVDWYRKGVRTNKASKSWLQLAKLIDPKGS